MAIKLLNNIDFSVSSKDTYYLSLESALFLKLLKGAIKKSKIKAIPFIGGSFAKNTMVQSDNYDIDIFIRFDKKYSEEQLSSLLQKIAKNLKIDYNKLHGSRDYIQIEKSKKLTFEVIPVVKINKPKEARNTTDLSYFHVNYVKSKLKKNKKLIREIGLAKKFFKAQKVYGAESYISGFSGYAVECLIIYYKSFEKMLKAFLSLKVKDKIIIDSEKQHKKGNILMEINESKTHSPIVLVDPTFKERNVLAALSEETFNKLGEKVKEFLSKPSQLYFEIKPIDEFNLRRQAKKANSEFVKIAISTDKQAGDIAGTKLKKFSRYLISEIKKYFDVVLDEFDYKLGNNANIYLIAKSKKEIIKRGPPIKMKKDADAFRRVNKKNKVYIEDKRLYARVKVNFSCREFINSFAQKYSDKINEMDVGGLKVY